jgi:hypothetical protein
MNCIFYANAIKKVFGFLPNFTRPFDTRSQKLGENRIIWEKLSKIKYKRNSLICKDERRFLNVSENGEKVPFAVSNQVPSTTQPPFHGPLFRTFLRQGQADSSEHDYLAK